MTMVSTRAMGPSRLKNSLAARVLWLHAVFIIEEAALSTPAVHVSTVPWNRLTNPARHTLVSMAHMNALPNGIRSRPSCVVMSLKPAASTPHTAAIRRNGSTWSLTQSDTKNEVPWPGVHDMSDGFVTCDAPAGSPMYVVDARLKNVRAMDAADEPMNTPRKIHPTRLSRCPSMPPPDASPIRQTMRAPNMVRLMAAAMTSTACAMLRYLPAFASHASYMGTALACNVDTVPPEATSVLRLVLNQSIVSSDCCSYIVHMVFSSQLSLRVLSQERFRSSQFHGPSSVVSS